MNRAFLPLVMGIAGFAVLLSLGIWQTQRLAWKEGMLAEIEARIADSPRPLTEVLPTPTEFAPVTAEGRFLEGEAHVLSSIKGIGAVFRVIAPFEVEGGPTILVDRGWVQQTRKDEARPIGPAAITGNFRTPEEVDGFTPDPDLAANYWFARDVPALAEALGTDPILVILRNSSESDPSVTPMPVDTAGIPNDHLQYAITWFSLAAIWVLMTGAYLIRLRRRTD